MYPNNSSIKTLNLSHFQDEFQHDYRLLHHTTDGRDKISKAHKHDFYLLFLVEKGSGTHTIDLKEYHVANQQLHILLPNQLHSWDLAPDTEGYQFMINRQVFESFQTAIHISYLQQLDNQVFSIDKETCQALLYEFQQLNKALLIKEDIPWQIIYTRSQLISLLISKEIEQQLTGIVQNKLPALVLRFVDLVKQHFVQEKTVAFYADKLHITPNYLNILCKRSLQISALTIIQQRIMQEAKNLLKNSKHSIKEIAFTLGFEDSSYFSNYFKKQEGISPSQYPRKL